MRVFFTLLLLSAAALAADLKIKIVDPRSAPVIGAQVSLLAENQFTFKTGVSSPQGEVSFSGVPAGAYKVQVLAPGFAPETASISSPRAETITISLHLATATET